MHKIGLFTAAAVLMAGPALAQAPQYAPVPAPMPQAERAPAASPHRAPSTYESQRTPGMSRTGRSAGAPIDVGPHTPQANAAFMGGGVILEAPPGAPAPEPRAITTPPGPDGVVRDYTRIDRN